MWLRESSELKITQDNTVWSMLSKGYNMCQSRNTKEMRNNQLVLVRAGEGLLKEEEPRVRAKLVWGTGRIV